MHKPSATHPPAHGVRIIRSGRPRKHKLKDQKWRVLDSQDRATQKQINTELKYQDPLTQPIVVQCTARLDSHSGVAADVQERPKDRTVGTFMRVADAQTHTTNTHTHTHTPLGIHPAATNPLFIKHCLMYLRKVNFQEVRGQSGLQAHRLCCSLRLYKATRTLRNVCRHSTRSLH